jgi:hypothetical protein
VLVSVGTQVSGMIKVPRADFNDRVVPEQVSAEVDPSLFRAALAQPVECSNQSQTRQRQGSLAA